VRVVLTPSPKPRPPFCSPQSSRSELYETIFHFPNDIAGVDRHQQNFFKIANKRAIGPTILSYSVGRSTTEEPYDPLVWYSIDFREVVYEYNELRLIDAWGRTARGTFWRQISLPNEAIHYNGAEADDAALFDQVLDGLCLENAAPDSEVFQRKGGVTRAQQISAEILPEELVLSGIVLNSDGLPVAGAAVEGAWEFRPKGTDPFPRGWVANFSFGDSVLVQYGTVTNPDGSFSIKTWGPALVIRKPGYRSTRLLTADLQTTNLRITLIAAPAPPFLCSSTPRTLSLHEPLFHFPRNVAGIKPLGRTSFEIATSSGPKRAVHAWGGGVGGGSDVTDNLWFSNNYEETVHDYNGMWLVDARGRTADGQWRGIGIPMEGISYSRLEPHEAALIDQFFDGMCLENGTADSPAFDLHQRLTQPIQDW
jgi:hypothetical protein